MGPARRHIRRLVALPAIAAFGVLVLAACAGYQPTTYTVERGDTLYSIAWRYDIDWRNLARWNGIGPPYRIRPGQGLRLSEPATGTVARKRPAPRKPQDDPVETRPIESNRPPEVRQVPPTASSPAPTPAPERERSAAGWRWPVNGKVLRHYARSHARRGIDIGGEIGADVRAAAPGRVVYSGDGLKGYGRLIIIKHDERYLSAYGFNRSLAIAEGDQVKAGQRIAEMGHGPENKPMLYFEIRQDGKPVDPETLLPPR